MASRHAFEQPHPRVVPGRFVTGPRVAETDQELIGGAQVKGEGGPAQESVFFGLGCRRDGSLDPLQLVVLGARLGLELLRMLHAHHRLIVVGVVG